MFWDSNTLDLGGFDTLEDVESALLEEERDRTKRSKVFVEQLFQVLDKLDYQDEDDVDISDEAFRTIRNLTSNIVQLWKDERIRDEIIPLTSLEDRLPSEETIGDDVDLDEERRKAQEIKRQAIRIEVLHDIADKTMQAFLYEFPHRADDVNSNHVFMLEKEVAAFTTLIHSYRHARQSRVKRRTLKRVLHGHMETVLEEFDFTVNLDFDKLLPKKNERGKLEEELDKLEDLIEG